MKKHNESARHFASLTDSERFEIVERSTRKMYVLDSKKFRLPEGAFRDLARTLLSIGRYEDYLGFDREKREIIMQLLIDEDEPIETPFALNDAMHKLIRKGNGRLLIFIRKD